MNFTSEEIIKIRDLFLNERDFLLQLIHDNNNFKSEKDFELLKKWRYELEVVDSVLGKLND